MSTAEQHIAAGAEALALERRDEITDSEVCLLYRLWEDHLQKMGPPARHSSSRIGRAATGAKGWEARSGGDGKVWFSGAASLLA